MIPYRNRGRRGGTQDAEAFAKVLADAGAGTKVTFHDWYNGSLT